METFLARYCLPTNLAETRGTEEYWRGMLCVVCLILGVVFSIPPLFMYLFWLKSLEVTFGTSIITALGVLQMLLLRIVGNVRFSSVVMIIWLFGTVVFGIVISGGIASAVSAGLYAPVLVALVQFGTRGMLYSLGGAGACIAVIVWLEYTFQLPQLFAPSLLPPIHGTITFSVISCTIFSFYYFDRVRRTAYDLLKEERDSVQLRVQESTQHLEVQNTALQRAIQEIELANKLKDEFLRNVSHEVRTPMTSILGFSEILLSQLPPNDDKRVFAEQMQIAATNLMSIFSNILTLSRIEAGETSVGQSRIETTYLLHHIQDAVLPLAHTKGLEFGIITAPTVPEYITIDAANTRSVLTYLAENAVKFTERGFVRVEVNVEQSNTEKGSSMLVCRVIDSGIGIAPEAQEHIFTPFYQQDGSKNRSVGGLGLGLAITKRMITAMNGSVTVISEVGKGSTFTVKIPCVTA